MLTPWKRKRNQKLVCNSNKTPSNKLANNSWLTAYSLGLFAVKKVWHSRRSRRDYESGKLKGKGQKSWNGQRKK